VPTGLFGVLTHSVVCQRLRLWLQDMEKGVKEFASQLETLVDRVISGQLAVEVTQNADKLVSGFIRHFEDGCAFRIPSIAAIASERLSTSRNHVSMFVVC